MRENLHLYGSDFIKVFLMEGGKSLAIGEDIVMFHEGSINIPLDRTFETDYLCIIHIIEGEEFISINNREFHIKGPCLLELIPNQPIRVSRIGSSLPKQEGVAFSQKYLQENFEVSDKILKMHQFMLDYPVLELGEDDLRELSLYVKSMQTIIMKDRDFNKMLCCTYLTMSLMISMILPITTSASEGKSKDVSAMKISVKFMDLLKEHYREEHKLCFYAKSLGISEKHLFASLKKETGKTATYWINFYLLSDAKRLLLNPELSILDISETLFFKSQSDFGKFFKRLSGDSPLKWRRHMLSSY